MTAADQLFRSARAAFDRGDYAAAREAAREGLAREDHHGLLQVYGLAALRLGEPVGAPEGLDAASLVARRGPLDPAARLTLAGAYASLGWAAAGGARVGRPRTARAMAKFLAEPGRCPTPLLPDLARLLGAVGAYPEALAVCRRLARARPWYHPAHYAAAFYQAELGRTAARVVRYLRAAHRAAPHLVPYRVALAAAAAKAGRAAEACALVRDLPAAAVGCPACLRRLGDAAEAAGDAGLAARLRDGAGAAGEVGPVCFGK